MCLALLAPEGSTEVQELWLLLPDTFTNGNFCIPDNPLKRQVLLLL
jgi:hypothetical protein